MTYKDLEDAGQEFGHHKGWAAVQELEKVAISRRPCYLLDEL